MTPTPFRDTARKIAEQNDFDFNAMQFKSDRARSHGWWRNLVEHGPWEGSAARVGPPTPEAFDGIAKLFGTSTTKIREMIATDWYGVAPDTAISARALRMEPLLDRLSEEDAELIENLTRRLAEQR